MGELQHGKWVGTTYGNGWMHRWLIRMLRVIPVPVLYAFAYIFVVPPTMIVNPSARNTIYRYFRQRHGFGPLKSACYTLKNHLRFAEVVIDRFAMYAGKRYRIDIDNYDLFLKLADEEKGFIQLSSHIGNYELAGYSLVAKTKRFNALVFGGEKESVMKNRSKMFDGNNIRMIAMQADMSHLFAIDRALADGEILSMPADRVFGSQKAFEVEILGAKASLPQGPFIMAATRDVPVLFTTVMKEGWLNYRISINEVKTSAGGPSRVKAKGLAEEFARQLESTLEKYPEQWYNYFDFWKE